MGFFKNKKLNKPKCFFAGYFCVIIILLIWNLLHCGSFSWEIQECGLDAGTSVRQDEEGRFELKDGGEILVSFESEGENRGRDKGILCGAALLEYKNQNNLRFGSEKLKAEILRESGQVIASAELPMTRQISSVYDETISYFTFNTEDTRAIEEGERLQLRIRSEGLKRSGVFFGTQTDKDGEAVAARIYYRTKVPSPFLSLFYFVLEVVIGFAALWLHNVRRMPLFPGGKKHRQAVSGTTSVGNRERGSGEGFRGRSISRGGNTGGNTGGIRDRRGMERNSRAAAAVLAAAAALAVLLLFMGTAYFRAVRTMEGKYNAGVLCTSENPKKRVTLKEGDVIRQRFVAEENMLGGFGVNIKIKESTEAGGQAEADNKVPGESGDTGQGLKTEKADGTKGSGESSKGQEAVPGDPVLTWRVLEEGAGKDTVLASGESALHSLRYMDEYLGRDKKDSALLKAAEKSRWLPLEEPVRDTAGRTLYLELALQPAGQGERGQADDESSLSNSSSSESSSSDSSSSELSSSESSSEASVRVRITDSTNGTFLLNGNEEEAEVCLLAGYRNNGFLKGLFFRLSLAVLVVFAALSAFCRLQKPSAQAAYLVAALSIGFLFSFMTPAFTVPDERTHVDTIYMISNDLLGIRDVPGPDKLYKRAADIDSSRVNTMPLTADRYREVEEGLFGAVPDLTRDGNASDGRELVTGYARTALENVTIFNYLPSAIGFTLGRLADRNLITMVMLARWMNLLASVLVMYAAVRKIPFGKACLAVIGLFPKTLQETASCSYDGMLIAGTFFFIACVFDMIEKADSKKVCVWDVLLLFYSGCFVAANKAGTYLPITGLVLFLPLTAPLLADGKKRLRRERAQSAGSVFSGKKGFKNACLMLAAFCCVFVAKSLSRVFQMLLRPSGSASLVSGTRTLYSVSDFVDDPLGLVRVMLNTVRVRGIGMIGEAVGKNLCQKAVLVGAFLILAYLGILRKKEKSGRHPVIPSAKEDGKESPDDYKENTGFALTAGRRIWLFLLITAGIALIFLAMLLGFTEKGTDYVTGLQGRYFLPYLPLIMLLLRSDRLRTVFSDISLIQAGAFLNLLTFFQILCAYFNVW